MTRSTTKRLRAADRRQDMIDVAQKVFLRQGYSGARTRDIAEAAGVSEAIIYRHFESKEELFEAAVLMPLEEHLAVFSAYTNDFSLVTNEERRARSIQIHEHAFAVMSDIVPLLGVAIFADGENGRAFYRRRIAPLIDRGSTVMAHSLEIWPDASIDPGFLFRTVFGSYLAISLDAEMRGEKVDAAEMGRRLTDLLSAALSAMVHATTAGAARTYPQEPAPSARRDAVTANADPAPSGAMAPNTTKALRPKTAAVKTGPVKTAAVKTAAVKTAAVKTAAAKTAAAKPAAAKPAAAKPAAAKPAAAKPAAVEAAAVEAAAVEAAAVEAASVKTAGVKAARVRAPAAKVKVVHRQSVPASAAVDRAAAKD